MIKPNELRVGNLIIYAGRIITVTAIKKNLIFNGKNFDLNMEPCYEPFRGIPLTDEILCEWCGFKKMGKGRYALVFDENVFHIDKDFVCRTWFRHTFIRSINFLHELQNILFALTGEELTVNIKKPAAQHKK